MSNSTITKSVVVVPGTAMLGGPGRDGTPPVNSGLDLTPYVGIAQLTFSAFGNWYPHRPSTEGAHYPNDLNAQVIDANGAPIGSLFNPLGSEPPRGGDTDRTVYNSAPFLMPTGAAGIQFGVFDSLYRDNWGDITITTNIVIHVVPYVAFLAGSIQEHQLEPKDSAIYKFGIKNLTQIFRLSNIQVQITYDKDCYSSHKVSLDLSDIFNVEGTLQPGQTTTATIPVATNDATPGNYSFSLSLHSFDLSMVPVRGSVADRDDGQQFTVADD